MSSTITIGDDRYIDYTPGSTVPAGFMIVQGEFVGYAEQIIPSGTRGSLRVRGKCECPADTPALTVGTIVYWDAVNERVTTTVGSNKRAGLVAEAKALNATRAKILVGR
jgi:predicted RecA/RadA family phage recombinase